LTTHQKTTKYCLEIQGKSTHGYKCEYCNKFYTQSQTLDTHIRSCKEKEKSIQVQKETETSKTIKKLENDILKLKRHEKDNLQKKDEYYNEKIKEKELTFLKDIDTLKEKLQEKEIHHEAILKEKNEYIAKLDAKLEKFENAVTNMAAATLSKAAVFADEQFP
jgi:hypothetical protein